MIAKSEPLVEGATLSTLRRVFRRSTSGRLVMNHCTQSPDRVPSPSSFEIARPHSGVNAGRSRVIFQTGRVGPLATSLHLDNPSGSIWER
jgi:hypothetical protein